MTYLHVTIKKKSNSWLCVFKSLSKSDLKKKFVKPYKLGEAIYYDGNILLPSEITQVKITKTEKSHNEELEVVQEESYKKVQDFNRTNQSITLISAGHGYNDYEINECGKNVTREYISSGPGVGTSFTKIAEFIKHPLVICIVSAVCAVIGAWWIQQWTAM